MELTRVRAQIIEKSEKVILSEWVFVGLVAVFVLLITSLPLVYAYQSTPSNRQFMGIMLDVPDHVQYFSWMRELTNANLTSNKLTSEPNAPVFFNLLWWTLGRFGKVFGLDIIAVFQVFRVTATLLFLALVYRVCSWFFKERTARQMSFLLIVFTSGLGWMLVVGKYLLHLPDLPFPLDVTVAEGNTFLSILGYPHFIAAALYILVYDLVLRGEAKGQLRYALAAGVVAFLLGWQHAYDLVSVYSVLLAYALMRLLRDRKIPIFLVKSGLLIGVISVWPAFYSVLLTRLSPIWKQVLAQFSNAGVYTPGLLHLPILLGIPFLLAIFTVLREGIGSFRTTSDQDLFLKSWFLATFLIIYLPVDFQIHLLNGWQIPICILAVQGIFRYLLPWFQKHIQINRINPQSLQKLATIGLLILVIPTNIYLLGQRFVELKRHDYPYYLYLDEVSEMSWLSNQPGPAVVVLSSLDTGQYIPELSGQRAFLAHWAQTVNFFQKRDLVQEFFTDDGNLAKKGQTLKEYDVQYVFYGPAERALGNFDPKNLSQLRIVSSVGQVTIYKVLN
jgi:hypothetical protein